jgi:hypothetical protein
MLMLMQMLCRESAHLDETTHPSLTRRVRVRQGRKREKRETDVERNGKGKMRGSRKRKEERGRRTNDWTKGCRGKKGNEIGEMREEREST